MVKNSMLFANQYPLNGKLGINELLELNILPISERNILSQNYDIFIQKEISIIDALRNTFTFLLFWKMVSIYDIETCISTIDYKFLVYSYFEQDSAVTQSMKIELNGVNLIIFFGNGLFLINEQFNFEDYSDWKDLNFKLLILLLKWLKTNLYNLYNIDSKSLDEHTKHMIIFFEDWLEETKNQLKTLGKDSFDEKKEDEIVYLKNIIESFENPIKIIDEKLYENEISNSISNSKLYYLKHDTLVFWDGWDKKPYSDCIVYGLLKAKLLYRYFNKETEDEFKLGDTEVKCINIKKFFCKKCFYVDKKQPLNSTFVFSLKDVYKKKGKEYLFPVNKKGLEFFNVDELVGNTKIVQNEKKLILNYLLKVSIVNEILIEITYDKKRDVLKRKIPLMVVWPNFNSKLWKNYYVYTDETNNDITANFGNKRNKVFFDNNEKYSICEYNQYPGSYIQFTSNFNDTEYGILFLKWQNPVKNEYVNSRFYGVSVGSTNAAISYYEAENDQMYDARIKIKNYHMKDLNLFLSELDNVDKIKISCRFFPILDSDVYNYTSFPVWVNSYKKTRNNLSFINSINLLLLTDMMFGSDEMNLYDLVDLSWIRSNFSQIQHFYTLLMFYLIANSISDGIEYSIFNWSYPSDFFPLDIVKFKEIIKNAKTELNEYIKQEKISLGKIVSEIEALSKYFYINEHSIYDPLKSSIFVDIGANKTEFTLLSNNTFLLSGIDTGFNLIVDIFKKDKELLKMFIDEGVDVVSLYKLPKNFEKNINVIFRRLSSEKLTLDKPSELESSIKYLLISFYYFSSVFYYMGSFLSILKKNNDFTAKDTINVFITGSGSKLLDPFISFCSEEIKNDLVNNILNYLLKKHCGQKDSLKFNVINSSEPKTDISIGILDLTSLSNNRVKKVYFLGETKNWEKDWFTVFQNPENLIQEDKDLFVTYPNFLNLTNKYWLKLLNKNNSLFLKYSKKEEFNFDKSYKVFQSAGDKIREVFNIEKVDESLFSIVNKSVLYKFCSTIWSENHVK